MYVCNYGPGGNVVGAAVYRSGAACSACPAGCTCVAGGLCRAPAGGRRGPEGAAVDGNKRKRQLGKGEEGSDSCGEDEEDKIK